MSHKSNDEINEQLVEEREMWLKKNLCTEDDVHESKEGEFIFWTENDGGRERIYLPKELTKKNIAGFIYEKENTTREDDVS